MCTGLKVDDPLIWYEGSAVSAATRRTLQPNYPGSIESIADASGKPIGVDRYDEYGVPATSNLGRFQYTGQAWLPELGLYYYKARFYDARLGRFLQTDPIGYQDDVNLYAYVGNDPLNLVDPFGLANCDPNDTNCVETPASAKILTPPPDKTEETQKMETVVVEAQKTKKNSDGNPIVFNDGEEHAQYVTPDGIHQAPIRPLAVVPCPGRSEVVVNVASRPLGTPSHTHPTSYGSSGTVPGPGDDRGARQSASHTAFMMTAANAFTIEAMGNGTFRTTVAGGRPLNSAQRAALIASMQNWEDSSSHDAGASNQKQYCGK